MVFVPLRVSACHGKAFNVSWDAALSLRDVGAEFFLIIRKADRLGTLVETTTLNFIKHQRVCLYVVQVFVDRDLYAADYLASAIVPQVRYYREGGERSRHRGVPHYEALSRLLIAQDEENGTP